MVNINFKILSFIFALLLFGPAFYAPSLGEEAREVGIAVLLSRTASPYDAAVAGFREVILEKGIKSKISVFDLEGSPEEGHRVMRHLKSSRPDLILAVGSTATEVAYNEAKAFPVIFTMVLYPEESGFIDSMQGSKNNLAGASLDIPPSSQFELLRSLVPGLRRIGLLYNPVEAKAIVEEAKISAQEMGLELIAVPVYSPQKVPDALRGLCGRVDALWSIADSTVFNSKSIKHIISYTLKNRVPFMGISSYFAREGALVSVSPDYFDVGRQSGEIAVQVLKGKTPASIPITRPRKVITSINLRTAWRIGLRPSSTVLAQADEIIK